MVVCQYCGHDTAQPDAAYCSYCGSSLSGARASAPAATAQPAPQQKGYMQQKASSPEMSARYGELVSKIEQQVTIVLILSVVTVVLALLLV